MRYDAVLTDYSRPQDSGMIIDLSGQAQQLIGKHELVVITKRVDGVVSWLAQMIKMGLPQILDRHLPRLPKPWQQEGLSWGWTAVIWLALSPVT